MANAIERTYRRNKQGQYDLVHSQVRYEFPMTLGRWEWERLHTDEKVIIYKRESGLSIVPWKVVTISKDKKEMKIFTDMKYDKYSDKDYIKCKNVNCKSRW